jgi:molybdopterin converting factor small subunit
MTITAHIPGALRSYCGGVSRLTFSAPTVRVVLEEIEARYPQLHRNICDETGAVRRHINLFVNTTHIRDLAGLDTVLSPGDEVLVVPAVSGG